MDSKLAGYGEKVGLKKIMHLVHSIRPEPIIDFSEWITKHTKLKEKPFSFKKHEYQQQILDDTSSRVVIRKSVQIGISEILIRKFLAFLAMYQGTQGIYTFPTAEEVGQFVKTRVDPVVTECQKIEELGFNVDNVKIKQIGKSFAHFRGSFGERETIAIPSDFNIHDEIDFSKPNVQNLYRSRMEHSEYAFEISCSTPTISMYGVDELFEASSQNFWHIKCPHSFHKDNIVIVKRKSDDKTLTISFEKLFELINVPIIREDNLEVKHTDNFLILDKDDWTDLLRVVRYKEEKSLLCIKTSKENILVTQDHPMIISGTHYFQKKCPYCFGESLKIIRTHIKFRKYKCNFCNKIIRIPRGKFVTNYTIKLAEECKKGDFLFINHAQEYSILKSANNTFYNIDPWLIGFYLAEGNVNKNHSSPHYSVNAICFVQKEGTMECDKMIKRINTLNLKYRIDKRKDKVVKIRIFNTYLAELFYHLGIHCENKHLPWDFLTYSTEYIGKIICGIIDGDGMIIKPGRSYFPKIVIRLTSYSLLSQIKIWLNKNNIQSNFNRLLHNPAGYRALYALYIYPNKYNIHLFKESIKVKKHTGFTNRVINNINNINEQEEIKNISKIDDYNDYFYDITTRSHTFISNNILVHNCNHWQILMWWPDKEREKESNIRSLNGIWDPKDTDKGDWAYVCKKCDRQIEYDPFLVPMQWVTKYPDKSTTGYALNALVGWGYKKAAAIVKSFFEYKEIEKAYNRILGLPYTSPGKKVTRGMIFKCMNNKLKDELTGRQCFMGADQAVPLVIIANFTDKGKIRIVHFEKIEKNVFDQVGKSGVVIKGRLSELMDEYDILAAVIDAQPNTESAYQFAKNFAGRVWTCFYSDRQFEKIHWKEDNWSVVSNRNRTLETGMQYWMDKRVEIFSQDNYNLPIYERFIDNMSSLTKVIDEDKDGRKTARWLTPKGCDFAHVWNYLCMALEAEVNVVSRVMTPSISGVPMKR